MRTCKFDIQTQIRINTLYLFYLVKTSAVFHLKFGQISLVCTIFLLLISIFKLSTCVVHDSDIGKVMNTSSLECEECSVNIFLGETQI